MNYWIVGGILRNFRLRSYFHWLLDVHCPPTVSPVALIVVWFMLRSSDHLTCLRCLCSSIYYFFYIKKETISKTIGIFKIHRTYRFFFMYLPAISNHILAIDFYPKSESLRARMCVFDCGHLICFLSHRTKMFYCY